MGKGASDAAMAAAAGQKEVAQQLADFGKQQWTAATPQREATSKYWSDVMAGGPNLTRAVAPQVNAATQQYQTLRSAAKNLPPGGLRDISQRNVNLAEAGTKAGIYSGGVNSAVAALANQAAGGTQAGLSAVSSGGSQFGQAASNYSNLAQIGQQGAQGWGQLAAMV